MRCFFSFFSNFKLFFPAMKMVLLLWNICPINLFVTHANSTVKMKKCVWIFLWCCIIFCLWLQKTFVGFVQTHIGFNFQKLQVLEKLFDSWNVVMYEHHNEKATPRNAIKKKWLQWWGCRKNFLQILCNHFFVKIGN